MLKFIKIKDPGSVRDNVKRVKLQGEGIMIIPTPATEGCNSTVLITVNG